MIVSSKFFVEAGLINLCLSKWNPTENYCHKTEFYENVYTKNFTTYNVLSLCSFFVQFNLVWCTKVLIYCKLRPVFGYHKGCLKNILLGLVKKYWEEIDAILFISSLIFIKSVYNKYNILNNS